MSRSQFYKEYLKSESWQIKRKQVLRRDKRCRICGSNNVQLHVHHLSYKNLGNEPLEDLVTLCYECHYYIHIDPEMVNEIKPIQEVFYESYKPYKSHKSYQKTTDSGCGGLIGIILFIYFLFSSLIYLINHYLIIIIIISIMYFIYKSKK